MPSVVVVPVGGAVPLPVVVPVVSPVVVDPSAEPVWPVSEDVVVALGVDAVLGPVESSAAAGPAIASAAMTPHSEANSSAVLRDRSTLVPISPTDTLR